MDVYIDGIFKQTIDANKSDKRNQGQQVLFSTTGLPVGPHSIVLVKRSGVYMLVDGFEVRP